MRPFRSLRLPAAAPDARPALVAALAAAFLPALAPAPVRADIGPPVQVEIARADSNLYPVMGENFTFSIRLTSAKAASVQDFEFRSDRLSQKRAYAWEVVSLGLPPGVPASLQPMVPYDIPCTLLANDPTQRVTIRFKYNGQWYGESKSLLPRAARGATVPIAFGTKALPPGLAEPPFVPASQLAPVGPDTSLHKPQDPARVSAKELAEDAPRTGEKRDYNIRVRGRFTYHRSDGQWVGVDGATVWVMDEDDDWDDHLAMIVTDHNGYFDKTFNYDMDEDPDIYLEIEASNNRVTVEDSGLLEENYTWVTGTHDDFDGTYIDFGEFTGSDEDLHPVLHILTTGTRCYRWYADLGYVNIDYVEVQWPEDPDEVSWYNPTFEEIHISTGSQWNETTIAHEYTHHWVNEYASDSIDDYCNEPARCDEPDDCGHCLWCQESAADAAGEGFGDWMRDSFCRSLGPRYGIGPVDSTSLKTGSAGFRNIESISACTSVAWDQYDDPQQTEGYFAALLRDIEDGDYDDDIQSDLGQDELTMGREEIVAVVDKYHLITPLTFLTLFYAEYPDTKTMLWATAANNGYNMDSAPPGVVTNLTSPSHPVSSDLPDRTVEFSFTEASDDMAGIAGYCYRMCANSPQAPTYTMNLVNITSFTTATLDTGMWYMTIRALDRAEKWSNSYATYGPFNLRPYYPPDIRPYPDSGWAEALVPSMNSNLTPSSVPEPTLLTGNASTTYWNLCIQNIGELAAPYGWNSTVYLDGEWFALHSLPSNLAAGAYYKWNNRGPSTVRGGRHMLSVWTDSGEDHSERYEDDNRLARQWIWTPQVLSSNTPYTRAHPPDKTGGALSVGMFFSYNCDGLRSNPTTGEFQAVSVRALDNAADYDCRLHPYSTSATSGFALLGSLATSPRPAGCLDAVLFRGGYTYDIGVINRNDHWCDYVAAKTYSTAITFNASASVTLAIDRYLALHHFELTTAQTVTVTVDIDPSLGPLQVFWLDDAFETGDLLDYDALAVTDSTGHAQIGPVSMTAGYQCIGLYRDPQDVPGGGTAPGLTATVLACPTPCDLQPAKPTGWAYAFVPRPAADGTATSVPAPSTLPGDVASTYFNYAWTNAGTVGAPGYYLRTYVDGTQKTGQHYASLAAGTVVTRNSTLVQTVPAGRHTLYFRLDPELAVPEIDDADNDYGRQWVWIPPTMALRTPSTRASPGDPTAGWAAILTGGEVPALFNCDGLRMPAPSFNGLHGYWQAVATMPGAAGDVDPRLHELATSSFGGFSSPRVISGWAAEQSDFVLVSYRATGARAFDVGVVQAGGTAGYTAEAVASTFLASNPDGVYGPYSLSAQHIVQLLEVRLVAGPMAIGVRELAGDVDWGLSLYRADLPYHAKSLPTEQDPWITWFRQPGDSEWLALDVPVTGYYCLAVWKAGTADLAKNGQFELEFVAGLTSAPDDLPRPAADAIVAVVPNPFNPQTTIRYVLAAAGHARVAVYDVSGRRVAQLLDADLPAGQHQVRWDGRGSAGALAAAGTYFCRLETRSVVMTKKMALVK